MDEPEGIAVDGAEEVVGEGPGPHIIRAHLKTLPNRPGVYRMFDAKGDVLYVGKARSLKNRVASNVRLGGHTNRIAAMNSLTDNMELVTTGTE
ncbi:MAG: excinuclease ABC subunit C, partial [Parvibaculaceae bacterium]